jgi:hypothetical protein
MAFLRTALGALIVQLVVWAPAAWARAATGDGTPAAASKVKKPVVAQKRRPTKATRAPKPHGKSAHWAHRDEARAATSTINESISITPFPSQADATKRALAQNRRDLLADAEKAARASSIDDRWQTVLFDLRDLDARSDPEGCFWRLVAYYRLGQIERAREIRDKCELPPRDLAMLEAEDASAASLQPPMAMAEVDHRPAPVANPAPYAGASPTRVDR